MKEIRVQITSKSLSKSYVINLDDDFAESFEKEWQILTKENESLDALDLLKAFIQRSYENFLQSKELAKLVQKIEIKEK